VSQWNTVSPHCLLSNNLTSYSSLSPSERLGFWTGTTTHLVVPVNGDLPFRFFDGLITLSCLLMPFNLKHQVNMLNLDEGEKNLIVYFRPSTLTSDEMNRLIEMCRHQWEQVIAGGADEITKDIEARVKNHHVSNRIERLIREVDEIMHEDPQ